MAIKKVNTTIFKKALFFHKTIFKVVTYRALILPLIVNFIIKNTSHKSQ